MIARLRVLLPFTITIPTGETFPAFEFDVERIRVRIHAPYKSEVQPGDLDLDSTVTLRQVNERLAPAQPQPFNEALTVDGAATIQADVLQVDFIRESFDRSIGAD